MISRQTDRSSKPVRTIYMGSPAYAATILSGLHISGQNIVSVITQPDKRVGRGKKMQSPQVKITAEQYGLPCYQPAKLNTEEFQQFLNDKDPELIIVAAYGKILRNNVLKYPKFGCINVHASLLPRWRGASPIQAAILNGDKESGVTIMKMDEGIDTGDIISTKKMEIDFSETAGSLTTRLAEVGAKLLVETLPGYLNGDLPPIMQPEGRATYSGLIQKKDGLIDFSNPADFIERMVRAFDPWPVAFFNWDGENVKIFTAEILKTNQLKPGQHGVDNGYPCVGTETKDLKILEIQMPSKNRVDGKVFLNGARNWL